MDQLEEVKSKIDLVELISEYVPLKKTGRNFKAICPFHSETAPSFIVSPERQIWKCFGCSRGGDHFRFLMEMDGLEFGEALRTLAKRVGVKLRSYRPSEGERVKQLLYEINHLAGEFFHYLLLNHGAGKPALDYILGRGITKKSLELFKIGYAPAQWDGLIKYLANKKQYRLEDIEKAGLIIKGQKGFYDRFRGRLMFPLKDHRNSVCGFAGRVLQPEVKEAKYVNTPETMVYFKSNLLYGLSETKQAIKKQDEAVLVEGELDLISSYQAGVQNVIAIKGSALTEHQVRLLSRFTQNLTFALDQDVAGDAAARRGIQVADAAGMAIKVVILKGGKDPDEVAQKDPKKWQKLVKEAVGVYDYFLSAALDRFDPETAEGKRKISQELIPVLAKISNEIVRAHYAKHLSESLGVDEAVIDREMAKVEIKSESTKPSPSPHEATQPSRRESLEAHLLALAFQSGQWLFLRKKAVMGLVKTPRYARIIASLNRYFKKSKTFKSERLAKMLPAELVEVFNGFYLQDLTDLLKNENQVEKELVITVGQMETLDLKEKLSEISREISQLERKKTLKQAEKKQLDSFTKKFRDLSQELKALNSA
jgi:DNA primase